MLYQLEQFILKNVIGPDSGWFWTMTQGVAVTLTLILIYRQLVAQRYTNILNTIACLDGRWNSIEMRKARKSLCAKYGRKEYSINQQDGFVLDFFEQIGLYLKKGVFTSEILWELYSYYIEHYWLIAKPLITEFRLCTEDKTWYSSFESLYETMQKQNKRRGLNYNGKTKEQLEKFIEVENKKL